MRILPLVLTSLIAISVSSSALAADPAPLSPEVLVERLAAGEAAHMVADDAGCADVANLEAYLLDEPTGFLRVAAPFQANEVGARPELVTPLHAEQRGLRAGTPFSAFAVADGLFGPAGLSTSRFSARWHNAPLSFPEPPGLGQGILGGFEDRFALPSW